MNWLAILVAGFIAILCLSLSGCVGVSGPSSANTSGNCCFGKDDEQELVKLKRVLAKDGRWSAIDIGERIAPWGRVSFEWVDVTLLHQKDSANLQDAEWLAGVLDGFPGTVELVVGPNEHWICRIMSSVASVAAISVGLDNDSPLAEVLSGYEGRLKHLYLTGVTDEHMKNISWNAFTEIRSVELRGSCTAMGISRLLAAPQLSFIDARKTRCSGAIYDHLLETGSRTEVACRRSGRNLRYLRWASVRKLPTETMTLGDDSMEPEAIGEEDWTALLHLKGLKTLELIHVAITSNGRLTQLCRKQGIEYIILQNCIIEPGAFIDSSEEFQIHLEIHGGSICQVIDRLARLRCEWMFIGNNDLTNEERERLVANALSRNLRVDGDQ